MHQYPRTNRTFSYQLTQDYQPAVQINLKTAAVSGFREGATTPKVPHGAVGYHYGHYPGKLHGIERN